jgi:hypothetical protein
MWVMTATYIARSALSLEQTAGRPPNRSKSATDNFQGNPALSILGDTLKYRREHDNISLREASKLCGVSHATLSRVERGEDPDMKSFARLCRWLALSPSMFLSENGLR